MKKINEIRKKLATFNYETGRDDGTKYPDYYDGENAGKIYATWDDIGIGTPEIGWFVKNEKTNQMYKIIRTGDSLVQIGDKHTTDFNLMPVRDIGKGKEWHIYDDENNKIIQLKELE